MGESKRSPDELPRVLLCGLDPKVGESLAGPLRANGFAVDLVAEGADALDRIRREEPLVVVTALRVGGMSALDLLREAKERRPGILVVMTANRDEMEQAVEGIRRGAWDYLRPPAAPEDLLAVARRAAEQRRPGWGADAVLRRMLKSQYHAVLAMLREAVERCPDAIWDDARHVNRTWQIACHALFFGRYYGGRDETFDDFWPGLRRDNQNPDGIAGPPDPKSPLPHVGPTYTKAEILKACAHVDGGVDAAVDSLDLAAAQSGFPWYPIPKLEHQLVNLRHIQHHTGQISERLRSEADIGIAWAGARRR